MATRNILKDDDKGLCKKSRVVSDFNKRLHMLLDDMRETLIEANGLGLAAPQVGVLRRVALIVDTGFEDEVPDEETIIDGADNIEDENDDYEELEEFNISEHIVELINPEIISINGEQTGTEGCLSIPGVVGMVTRPQTVVVKAQDRYGDFFELEVSDLTARAVCHEVDHLDGVLFTSIADRILSDEELAELTAQREQNSQDNE